MCDTPDASTGLVPDITRCEEPSTWGYTLDDGPNATHNAVSGLDFVLYHLYTRPARASYALLMAPRDPQLTRRPPNSQFYDYLMSIDQKATLF